jgi:hypothetical protein
MSSRRCPPEEVFPMEKGDEEMHSAPPALHALVAMQE